MKVLRCTFCLCSNSNSNILYCFLFPTASNWFHINIYSTFSQVQKFIRIILLYINWIWSRHKISVFQWMLWLVPTPQVDTQSLCIQYTTYKQNASCGHMPDLQHKCTDTDMSTRYWHIYTFHQMGAEGARSQGGFMDSLSGIQIIKLGYGAMVAVSAAHVFLQQGKFD